MVVAAVTEAGEVAAAATAAGVVKGCIVAAAAVGVVTVCIMSAAQT